MMQKFFPVLLAFACMFMPLNPQTLAAQTKASLCASGEETLFLCDMKTAPKTLALCAGQKPPGKRYLQVRIKGPSGIEMDFPPQHEEYLTLFNYSHIFPVGADDTSLRFMNGSTNYELYSQRRIYPYYQPTIASGLLITMPDGNIANNFCGVPTVDNLARLEELFAL